jgi:ketosteroid isomerase-like protein
MTTSAFERLTAALACALGKESSMRSLIVVIVPLLFAVSFRPTPPRSQDDLTRQVFAAESSFARSMADRDFEAFARHVADEAVFFGASSAQRGKAAVLAAWRPFFEGTDAPFSWAPRTVEVLASGTLAHSSGPVLDPDGNQVGTFNSIWRREPDGRWLVVFDKGCSCPCAGGP